MTKLYAMYRTPVDAVAFDRYYFGPHLALARAVPGLKSYEVTRGPIMTMTGPAPFYLIATLGFDSMASLQAALASEQGQATAADLANFATGGVELFIADTEMI